MADKISGYGSGGVDITASRARAAGRGERAASERSADAREPAVDAVKLTDTATTLKQIEARLGAAPDVDRARVDAMRQRVESGAYRVDAQSVAAKLLKFEQDMA